jgi:uncharacterized protein YhfF
MEILTPYAPRVGEIPERVCELGSPGPLRDRLVEAVLQGRKTATCSLLAEWEREQEPLPTAGERQAVIDSDGRAVGVVEIMAVDVIRLADADLRLAIDEGEGFTSVAEWREAHERFWTAVIARLLPGERGVSLNDDTPLVVERFRLVSSLPAAR